MSPIARKTVRLAVLIDAENISPKYVGPLLEEVAKYRTATAKRAYGDWTRPQHAKWRNLLNLHALIPVQQFQMSVGKNCTDCALIIDAMALLYSGNFDGFCIVSSDSDFTRLACRIRESGLQVYGFGESKTPVPFVKSCDRFIALELLTIPTEGQDGQVLTPGSMGVERGRESVSGGQEGSGKTGGGPHPTAETPTAASKDAASPVSAPAGQPA